MIVSLLIISLNKMEGVYLYQAIKIFLLIHALFNLIFQKKVMEVAFIWNNFYLINVFKSIIHNLFVVKGKLEEQFTILIMPMNALTKNIKSKEVKL